MHQRCGRDLASRFFRRKTPQPQFAKTLHFTIGLIFILAMPLAIAQTTATEDDWNLFGQVTSTTQQHGSFNAPYSGANSLQTVEPAMETVDITLFLGARVWKGGEVYFNPEIDQGYGLSGTLGIAGFTSGEAYKVGAWQPYFKLQRYFLRQTFALEGDSTAVESGPNTLAGQRPNNNVTITAGKFSVVDIFDTNPYAHDSRGDFLNWTIIDSGAFDYAADAWGYTLGTAAEWNMSDWTLRGGYFALSTIPNSTEIDRSFSQVMTVLEAERRYQIGGHPGSIKALAFLDHGNMARYADMMAVSESSGQAPNPLTSRRPNNKTGYGLNLAQEVADNIGAFLRYSRNDGKTETFEFSDINQSLAAGIKINGALWGRAKDQFGLAGVRNGLFDQARAYYAAGGLGLLIGDGKLPHYGNEQIIETFYSASLYKQLTATFDYQHISNPGYNPDRGPVSVYGVRVHYEF